MEKLTKLFHNWLIGAKWITVIFAAGGITACIIYTLITASETAGYVLSIYFVILASCFLVCAVGITDV